MNTINFNNQLAQAFPSKNTQQTSLKNLYTVIIFACNLVGKENTSKFVGKRRERGGWGGALNDYHPCYTEINKKGIRNANIPKKRVKKLLFWTDKEDSLLDRQSSVLIITSQYNRMKLSTQIE